MDEQKIRKQNKAYSIFPYTEQRHANPEIYEKGEGIYIYDTNGNRYMDLASQYVNVNIGFGNKEIIQAITEQLEKLHYCKPLDGTEIRGKLCKKIITEIAPPNMKKVFLTLGGSDANDSAVRIAKAVTGKRKILSQSYSYHGATIGAANLCGDGESIPEGLEHPDYVHFMGYNSRRLKKYFNGEETYCDFLLDLLEERILLEEPNTIAAIFFETISLAESMMPSKRYYEGVRKLCDKYGILLVFDEVLVGFGRTGTWFACEHYGVWPDIMTFAKGITSSYMPLGGVMVSGAIADRLEYMPFNIALTASFHPASCAAGHATITYMQKEQITENAEKMGNYLRNQLEEKILPHNYVEKIDGIGLMQTVFFRENMNSFSAAEAFCELLKEKGYITWVKDTVVVITPPLIINEAQIDQFVEDFKDILESLETNQYLEKISLYPEESLVGAKGFYSLHYIKDITKAIEPYQNLLVFGSANLLMLKIVMASLEGNNKEHMLYLSKTLFEQLNRTEKAKSVFFEGDRFDLERQYGEVRQLQREKQYDCILMPYGREDQDWFNIVEVAETFGLPIFLILKDGTIKKIR